MVTHIEQGRSDAIEPQVGEAVLTILAHYALARSERCHELLHRRLRSSLHFVQIFRLQVRIAPQHAPIFMAGHHCDLLDRKTGFEQATGPFMAQVMKTQIVDIDIVARPMESSSDRFRVVRKHAPDPARDNTLLENDLPCVVAPWN
jgi:hypothetical protein